MKRLVFFNQVLIIGLFATLFQIPSLWEFIGVKALLFLAVAVVLGICLFLNFTGNFRRSKELYVLFVFSFGSYSVTLIGGAALYHLQAILIFFSCLIILDHKKEVYLLIAGFPFMIFSILIGEFGWFEAPDFSDHPLNSILRVANIASILGITTIFILFINRLNKLSESALTSILEDVKSNARFLEKGKQELESIVQDRTSELSKQRDILKIQNEEKEILLKEVHHRVRNNLQIIISLINLQLESIQSDKTTMALQEIQSRVSSMSLIHHKMYQSANLKEIELDEYAKQIISNLGDLYGIDQINYRLAIPKNLKLEMDQAIPLGLILNEIISNFLKHVKAEGERFFTLKVDLNAAGFDLIYQDNGPGFPKEMNITKLNSLGIQLISNLSEQLDGSCEFNNNKGAFYKITIPVNQTVSAEF